MRESRSPCSDSPIHPVIASDISLEAWVLSTAGGVGERAGKLAFPLELLAAVGVGWAAELRLRFELIREFWSPLPLSVFFAISPSRGRKYNQSPTAPAIAKKSKTMAAASDAIASV